MGSVTNEMATFPSSTRVGTLNKKAIAQGGGWLQVDTGIVALEVGW